MTCPARAECRTQLLGPPGGARPARRRCRPSPRPSRIENARSSHVHTLPLSGPAVVRPRTTPRLRRRRTDQVPARRGATCGRQPCTSSPTAGPRSGRDREGCAWPDRPGGSPAPAPRGDTRYQPPSTPARSRRPNGHTVPRPARLASTIAGHQAQDPTASRPPTPPCRHAGRMIGHAQRVPWPVVAGLTRCAAGRRSRRGTVSSDRGRRRHRGDHADRPRSGRRAASARWPAARSPARCGPGRPAPGTRSGRRSARPGSSRPGPRAAMSSCRSPKRACPSAAAATSGTACTRSVPTRSLARSIGYSASSATMISEPEPTEVRPTIRPPAAPSSSGRQRAYGIGGGGPSPPALAAGPRLEQQAAGGEQQRDAERDLDRVLHGRVVAEQPQQQHAEERATGRCPRTASRPAAS